MYDLIISNVNIVRPLLEGTQKMDIAILNGKIAEVKPDIDQSTAHKVFDGKNLLHSLV